jgi:signal transduction histidine kinase
MLLSRPGSVRSWLGTLVLVVAVPVLLLLIVICVTQVRREQTEAREMALRIARATAMRLRAMDAESAAVLRRMTVQPAVLAVNPATCHAALSVVDFLPRYADVFLFDATGKLVCSGNTDPENAQVSLLASPWIANELRARRLRGGTVLMHTFGRQAMSVTAMPVRNTGTIVLLEFVDVVGRTAFIPGSVILIADRSGTVVARSDPATQIDRKLRLTQRAEPAWNANEGIADARAVDGVARQYAFVQLPEHGWTVYGGVPSWALAEPVREMLINASIGSIGIIFIVVVMTLVLARKIGRPIYALAGAATAADEGAYARVRSGEGPREIVALTNAFNQMVDRREEADERMRNGERKLKALSERLLTVQEEERGRIARELHDDLGQALTALKMDIVGLLQATPQPLALSALRERILRTLDSTVTAVQRISSELRPSVLDDLGLVAAIEAEARLLEERSGIECEVSVAGDVTVQPEYTTMIYRIVQEALTNVVRHSNATRVEVRLRHRGEELLLEVRDDGRGVRAEELDSSTSFGLIGIRERVAMVGGSVQFEGVDGRGTIVSVRIPLADAQS